MAAAASVLVVAGLLAVVGVLASRHLSAGRSNAGHDTTRSAPPTSSSAASSEPSPTRGRAPDSTASAPRRPHPVCGDAALLSGTNQPPPGAVVVPAGNDSPSDLRVPHTTYWFAPGTHTLGTGRFSQIIAGSGDAYLGGQGAVISGQGKNDFAFTGHATGVSVEYLTIRDFMSPTNQGVVNHTAGAGWTIEHDTVETNPLGAGVEIGSHDLVEYDCLTHNGEYGFNAYATTGVTGPTLSHDEISFNDGSGTGGGRYDQGPATENCGCSGGGKFWETTNAAVTTNWVHDNGDVGIWVDTDNRGFLISDNYISGNYAEGVMYEISYNADISDNTLVDNGWGKGPTLAGFPVPAIYISESGGDRRVASNFSGSLRVTGNVLRTDWGGVVLWENSNRFCGNGDTNVCTLVDPSLYTAASCASHLPGSGPRSKPDFFGDCRWKTQNVRVSENLFTFDPRRIGASCTVSNNCGFNALFSEYGSVAPFRGWVVPFDISDRQHDVFAENTYVGPWRFEGFSTGEKVTWRQWTSGFNDIQGSGDHFDPQDRGSILHP